MINNIQNKKEDIIRPNSSSLQKDLWKKLETNITETNIKREEFFSELPEKIRILLSSKNTSDIIKEIIQKYKLLESQGILLAKYIKNIFTIFPEEKEYSEKTPELQKLINTLSIELELDQQITINIFNEINKKIISPALKN